VYRIITDGAALDQIAALPASALHHCAEALLLLEIAPERGRPYNEDKPDAPMRELVFGTAGQGTITYLLLERERDVHVLVVQWVG
jgi:hypothetical protein